MSGLRDGRAMMRGRKRSGPRRAGLWLAVLGFAWLGAVRAGETTLPAAEWRAIQGVIAAQRAALINGEADKAFAYASPAIQRQFGDAASFTAMVDSAYGALESARYVEFLDGAVIDGIVVQPLRLIDRDNTVRVALYTMEKQADGRWRISGCRIAPSTVHAA
ncbi:MAG: DUF4864 domain-containing protein [Casimicrobiaceae bacterium]